MFNQEIIQQFVNKGKQTELEFAKVIQRELGGEIKLSTINEDMYKHIDLYWNNYGIDVKGLKRSARDQPIDENTHWVELINVNGHKGWLYGDATYFAFETLDYWILISKNKLMKFVLSKIDLNSSIWNTIPPYYSLYQRLNRKDLIVKVKTIDLMVIANKILKK